MTAMRSFLGVLLVTVLACSAKSTGGEGGQASTDDDSTATSAGGSATGGSATGGSATGGSATGGSAAGGNSAGGSATGGNSSGGSATGGSSSGGSGSGGTSSNFSNTPECNNASQCSLVNDCCYCQGLAPGETAPACGAQLCKTTTCQVLGLGVSPAAQCQVGRCVAGFDCDLTKVLCKSSPPNCPAGETPSVQGICYGPCVPAVECATVADCNQCDASAHVCVSEVTQLGPTRHCVEQPSGCASPPSCACMGASVCLNPFDQCSDATAGELKCDCPTC